MSPVPLSLGLAVMLCFRPSYAQQSATDPKLTAADQGQSTVERLLSNMRSPDAEVRSRTARTLGSFKAPGVVAALDIALEDPDPFVRYSALDALGNLKDHESILPLIAAMKSMPGRLTDLPERARNLLASYGSPAVEPLIDALRSSSSEIRAGAAGALGQIADPHAVPSLITSLNDPVPDVGRNAALSLGRIKDPRAAAPLVEAMRTRDWQVRDQALEALKIIRPLPVVPLVEALNDPNLFIRINAANLLTKAGASARDAILGAMKNADPRTRMWASYDLAFVSESRSNDAPFLTEAVEDVDWRVRASATWGLEKFALFSAQVEGREPSRPYGTGQLVLRKTADEYVSQIQRGKPGSEELLALALMIYGDSGMALAFYNSGNADLAAAASFWAREHGYVFRQGPMVPSGSGIRWGRK